MIVTRSIRVIAAGAFPLPAAADDVAVGAMLICARLVTGAVWCSGYNALGSSLVPVEVPSLAGANQVAVEYASGCAIKSGALSCFGQHITLGDGNSSPWQPQPVTACP